MANSIFSGGNVGTVSVKGLIEAQARLQRTYAATDPNGGEMRTMLLLASGMVHRYLFSLGKDRPPVGQTGVLPIITGRLKNSFFFGVRGGGNSQVGFVATNLLYAPDVEKRRGFLAKTVKEMAKPVNDLFAHFIASKTK